MVDLDRAVRDKARALGFDAVGVAAADEPLELEFGRYEAFVDAGMHGEMGWLADDREVRRRLDGEGVLAGARSVICVAESYAGADDPADRSGVASAIARYARGLDYHNHLRKRLRRLAAFVRTLGEGVEARPLCDDAPLLERAWAARAGLGFVGKNGMLIVPGTGSFVLLGEVVTTLRLTPGAPMSERCGSCTACLEGCPTDAFVRPFVLDARRCISYLTIELRSATPEPLRDAAGAHLFGCDDCQDVCPWNQAALERGETRARYRAHPRWRELSAAQLAALEEGQLERLLVGSPLHRATPAGLVRDAVTMLARARDPLDAPLLERLARDHADAAVREHAAWALGLLAP